MKQSLPNFFIIGAPKCGTTSLQYYLEQHHDVFFAPKELHFFGEDLKIKNHFNEQNITISAQLYLKKFYQSHGFIATSKTYLEDDIPHIEMKIIN